MARLTEPQGSLHLIRTLRYEETLRVRLYAVIIFLWINYDGRLSIFTASNLNRQQQQLELDEAELGCLSERHADERARQVLGVHLHSGSTEVIILPVRHLGRGLVRSHGEQIGHHRGEARRKAALRNEAQLQFAHTDHIVAVTPVPRGNVQQVGSRERGTNI